MCPCLQAKNNAFIGLGGITMVQEDQANSSKSTHLFPAVHVSPRSHPRSQDSPSIPLPSRHTSQQPQTPATLCTSPQHAGSSTGGQLTLLQTSRLHSLTSAYGSIAEIISVKCTSAARNPTAPRTCCIFTSRNTSQIKIAEE